MYVYRLVPALLALLLFAGKAPADTVILTNGDTVSGNIRRVADGTLVLQSRLLGTLRIKWDSIESIRSESRFSILTEAGDLWEGQVTRTAGRTAISSEGQTVATLDSDSVARIVPGRLRKGPLQLLRATSGTADLGYSLARGNQNQTQSSLGARAEYRSVLYKFSGRIDSLFARQDGARSQSRHALNMRLDRFLNASTFSYGLSGFERNERRRLDLRTQLGGGIGWHLADSKAMDLSVLGGFAYVHERFRDLDDRATGEGSVGLEWSAALFKGARLLTQLSIHPDMVDRGRFRMEYDSTLRLPIAGRFTYSLRLFDRFDSRPAASVERNDYGVVSGLGVRF